MSEYDEQAGVAPEDQDAESGATSESVSYAHDQADDVAVPEAAAPGDDRDAPATGVSAVDDVLAAVEALDGRPVEEHVAVFEQAHERLRRALDPGHG
jgi:hypothetical protein